MSNEYNIRSFPKTIILEGPDGSGKSTLMNQLYDILKGNVDTIHYGPFSELDKIAPVFTDAMLHRKNEIVIMDRCWISEPIYADSYKRPDRISVGDRRMLERIALTYQPVVVMCVPPFEVCSKTFTSRKDEEYLNNLDQLKEVYNGYWTILNPRSNHPRYKTALPTIMYDYTQPHASNTLYEMLSCHGLLIPTNEGPGIGKWAPGKSILLIGDIAYSDSIDLPFVDILEHHQKEGEFLANELEKANIDETKLYWFNAYDKTLSSPKSSNFIKELNPKKIVALGVNAAKWCIANNLEHKMVVSPSYEKKFGSKFVPYFLLEVLKNVV